MPRGLSKRIISVLMALLILFAYPATGFADTTSDQAPVADSSASNTSAPAPTTDSSSTTPSSDPDSATTPSNNASSSSTNTQPTPSQTQQGPTSPPGPDSKTYTYNQSTGLWENAYYTWDPVTHQTKPKTAPSYSYNPATGHWDTTQWIYDAPSQKYVPSTVSVNLTPTTAASISQTGPGSGNTIKIDTNNNGVFDLFYNAKISNVINADAMSGDASVTSNTLGGNALTGNATDIANILNMLQSNFNLQPSSDLLTFTSNINGNVTGDLTLDPSEISTTGPLSVSTIDTNTNNNLTVNQQGSGLINNDINLNATSGNASVSYNTTGGNATSGTANAVADVVNLLNSSINAGKSFLGVVNINGNLNGDILLPDNFLNQLISNSGPSSTVTNSQTTNNTLNANLNSNDTINNNVNLTAASGSSTVNDNTSAGNATTGNATTNLTILNLTGKQVIGANSILVFVNVLGHWMGLIMNAPAGSNSAALCGGSCQISQTTNNTANLNGTSNNTINNNITNNAHSGDASVTDNTKGGNATSGDATSSANIANLINSNMSLSGWLGILFINVFGTWNGSFGVNTAAGNSLGGLGGGIDHSVGSKGVNANNVKAVFGFTPKGDGQYKLTYLGGSNDTQTNSKPSVLATKNNAAPPQLPSLSQTRSKGMNFMMPFVISTVVIAMIFGAEYGTQIGDRLRVMLMQRKLNKGKSY